MVYPDSGGWVGKREDGLQGAHLVSSRFLSSALWFPSSFYTLSRWNGNSRRVHHSLVKKRSTKGITMMRSKERMDEQMFWLEPEAWRVGGNERKENSGRWNAWYDDHHVLVENNKWSLSSVFVSSSPSPADHDIQKLQLKTMITIMWETDRRIMFGAHVSLFVCLLFLYFPLLSSQKNRISNSQKKMMRVMMMDTEMDPLSSYADALHHDHDERHLIFEMVWREKRIGKNLASHAVILQDRIEQSFRTGSPSTQSHHSDPWAILGLIISGAHVSLLQIQLRDSHHQRRRRRRSRTIRWLLLRFWETWLWLRQAHSSVFPSLPFNQDFFPFTLLACWTHRHLDDVPSRHQDDIPTSLLPPLYDDLSGTFVPSDKGGCLTRSLEK